jgi:hypothetical protein
MAVSGSLMHREISNMEKLMEKGLVIGSTLKRYVLGVPVRRMLRRVMSSSAA